MRATKKDVLPGGEDEVGHMIKMLFLYCSITISHLYNNTSPECNPKRIGFFTMIGGYCLNQGCQEVYGGITQIETYNYHWTSASCRIQVKVLSNGLIAIVHDPDQTNRPIQPETTPKVYPEAQSHVHPQKTISFFDVWWDESNVQVGKVSYALSNCFIFNPFDFLYSY